MARKEVIRGMKAIATEEVKNIDGRAIHFIQIGKLVQVNSTVSYGNMSYKYGPHEQVKANRELFWSDLLKVSEIKKSRGILEPIIMNPSMTKDIMVIGKQIRGEGWESISTFLKCDGLLLLKPPHTHIIPIGLPVADCAPVSIYIPTAHSILVIHVSWKNIDIIQEALQIAYGIHLAAASHKPFHLILIVGPAGRYLFYDKEQEKEILIDIHHMIEQQIVQFESQHSEDDSRLEAYFSNYLTTSGDIFFSNHILNHLNQPPARFMSLSFLI